MDCREERSSIVTGQMNLFGGESEAVRETPIPSLPELERSALLQLEHESLGLYLSGHPLEQSQWLRQLCRATPAAALSEQPDGGKVLLIVTLQHVKQHTTKKGETMCFLTCEDQSGSADCVVFPALYNSVKPYLQQDAVLYLRGKISQKENAVSVLCDSVLQEEAFFRTLPQGRLCVKIDSRQTAELQQLLAVIGQHAGNVPVCFYLTDRKKMLSPRGGQAVAVNSESYAALCAVVSPEQVGFLPPA